MGLRFRKSIKIAPGVRMNVGKKGVGVSVGTRGLRHTINSSGRSTSTVGLPGTGLSYSTSRSYKTPAHQKRNELAKREREQAKLAEQEHAKLQVELYENRIERMRSIHQESDEPVDWKAMYHHKPPFEIDSIGPYEQSARDQLESYRPSWIDRLFNRESKQRQRLEQDVYAAAEADRTRYEEWREANALAKRVLLGEVDTYYDVIESLQPFEDLLEFGSGFECNVASPEIVQVAFDVNAQEAIPTTAYSLTKTGKLSERAMTKTAYYDLYQDYVCGAALRIAREMFALLPVEVVYVQAYEKQLNTSTGHEEDVLILAVQYDRQTLEQMNMSRVDPSDALEQFTYRMNFRKTKGFAPVEMIQA